MAVTSEEEIMNSALRKVGAERINDQDDQNNRARLLKDAYPVVRDALLRSHPWNFAISYATLAAPDPLPDNIFDYDYVYELPANYMRAIGTDLYDSDDWEEIEGRYIVSNVSSMKLKFIKKVTDVTKFDDNFIEALAWKLADEICFPLTGNASRAKDVADQAKRYLQETRSYDAQVGSVKRVRQADDWSIR